MCLGIPGKVVEWIERDGVFARANVEFAGIRRVCHMACATEAEAGQYVLVHAGIALCRIDEAEARRLIDDLERLADAHEWPPGGPTIPENLPENAGDSS
jgi:hydrogenase expression/formation protein HypC